MNLFYAIIVALDFIKIGETGVIRFILELLLLIPIAVPIYTLVKFHEFLRNNENSQSVIKRFSIGLLILLAGIFFGGLSQFISIKIKDLILRIFSI